MIPKFDMLDPDDYAFTHYFAKIQKRFPSLRWDDIIRKGLEEWMLLAERDEKVNQIHDKCNKLKDDLYRWEVTE